MALSVVQPAAAIVIRHDRADGRYVVDAARFPQLFHLHTRFGNRICMATLISPQWAITAAHCTDETPLGETVGNAQPYALDVAGRTYHVAELVIHPDYQPGPVLDGVDLALIRLDAAVPDSVPPVQLYRRQDELARIALLPGWGHTGIGTTGREGNDGKFRMAHNAVSEAGHWLRFRFDDPRIPGNTALNLEGVPGLGDSGGPALLETADGLLLMGVALGELDTSDAALTAARGQQGLYGAIEIYERISSHVEWIDHITGNTQLSSAP